MALCLHGLRRAIRLLGERLTESLRDSLGYRRGGASVHHLSDIASIWLTSITRNPCLAPIP